jgi:hypothetical protein
MAVKVKELKDDALVDVDSGNVWKVCYGELDCWFEEKYCPIGWNLRRSKENLCSPKLSFCFFF